MSDRSERLERIATRVAMTALEDEELEESDRIQVLIVTGDGAGGGAALGYDEDHAVNVVLDLVNHATKFGKSCGVRVTTIRADAN